MYELASDPLEDNLTQNQRITVWSFIFHTWEEV
jgi:hypothetical protein